MLGRLEDTKPSLSLLKLVFQNSKFIFLNSFYIPLRFKTWFLLLLSFTLYPGISSSFSNSLNNTQLLEAYLYIDSI